MKKTLLRDPRLFQISFLAILLGFGVLSRDFSISWLQVWVVMGSILAFQSLAAWIYGLPLSSLLSASISGLSLLLLCRSNSLTALVMAGGLAVASKFLLRWRGKHVFNPTCFGIVILLLFSHSVWVSPGQWGDGILMAFWIIALGMTVLRRSGRDDIGLVFLATYFALTAARVLYLGQPYPVIWQQWQSGSLLIFAFFMISDPRSTPDHRAGRAFFAVAVALFAYYLRFYQYNSNSLIYSLFFLSPVTLFLDTLFKYSRFEWRPQLKTVVQLSVLLLSVVVAAPASGFCGFYVAKADASLFNRASQVVYVRDENKNALTLSNDFKGELTEFALVVPVPEVLKRDQINVGERSLIERVDAYSAPRLVEYFDPDPCSPPINESPSSSKQMFRAGGGAQATTRAKALGITIEAQYTVGEYDILILSAKESNGLETWLKESGYKLPSGASKALEPYIKQKMKFFVAKVNLKEQAKTGFTYLRPLQFAFESPKFMLPIRLGMINSTGPQDLIVYVITKTGRAETTNYRTVKLPTGMDVPVYVKDTFADFYRAVFDTSFEKENKKAVFTEYAWNMNWCDPCAADPLTAEELRKLGVFWESGSQAGVSRRRIRPMSFNPGFNVAPQAYITRLHVRYDAEHFPEDLFFQQTSDSENYQGRYVLRHAWTGSLSCVAGNSYRKQLKDRHEKEAETLAMLTGWKIGDIRKQMGPESAPAQESDGGKKWYQNIFK